MNECFIDVMNSLIDAAGDYLTVTRSEISPVAMRYESYVCPQVDRITFNGDVTIVWFVDGTKTIVKCSAGDTPDRQTAIAYAILKRMYGTANDDGTVDSTGFGSWLKKLVDSAFDQKLAEANEKKRKAEAKAAHMAKQVAEHEAAVKRRIAKRAEALKIEREAEKLLAAKTSNSGKKMMCESEKPRVCKCKSKISNTINQSSGVYVRPNKKFKDFTQDEKRAYWRYHNTLRK